MATFTEKVINGVKASMIQRTKKQITVALSIPGTEKETTGYVFRTEQGLACKFGSDGIVHQFPRTVRNEDTAIYSLVNRWKDSLPKPRPSMIDSAAVAGRKAPTIARVGRHTASIM